MLTDTDIQRLTDIIVEKFDPEKIILFGLYARGTATDDSDVDLIVVKETDEDLFDMTADIRMAVSGFRVQKDVLVRTPQAFERECAVYWTVFSEAQREGRLLYEKAS